MRHAIACLALLASATTAPIARSASVEPLRLPSSAALRATLVPVGGATANDPAMLSALLTAASAPENTPSRREARTRLFREHVPVIEREGIAPTPGDAEAMRWALGGTPCAGGPLRVADARVLGDAARVKIAGDSGGCSVLLRRQGGGWELVMVLGWTLTT